ncbi:MAG: hypothetical protein JWL92_187 [Candidatus Nomurabacteria bacterium]|nr:hypothetical protein [Candidatus Nomurabacteria bacterium]
MGKRGPTPRITIPTDWSANLAYAVGLIASDGCLYNDERHMSLTTKDVEQAENFKKCLGLQVKIGYKARGGSKEKIYCHVQFGNVAFYNFLLSIGLMPAKSKIMAAIDVPDEFFFDFLRGSLDGDGCFYSYWDPRWRSSHMFYIYFVSASPKHVEWLRSKISELAGVNGCYTSSGKTPMHEIKYAKREALELIKKMYYSQDVVCLSRKKLKIDKALEVEREQQSKY